MRLSKYRSAILACFLILPLTAMGHNTSNMKHSHAFKQTGYGEYRQGHYANGPIGSILIWSAKPVNSRHSSGSVRFITPEPISKPPANPYRKTSGNSDASTQYGKDFKKNYGK
jgi:hypothetical protein